MSSLLLSSEDIDFLLFDWLKVETLTERPRYADHDRQTFGAALDVYRRIAEEDFAPHNRSNDINEPWIDGDIIRTNPPIAAALAKFREAGLMAAARDYADGGMQLPAVIERAGAAWLQAANPATCVYPYLAMANANLLFAHGSPEQIDRFARPIAEGRYLGTMCLSEPQAGSSLGDIRTRAEPQADGSYRLFGNKMWTSAADHDLSENIVHLVLAKIPGVPVGAKGISLFIVPKYLVGEDGALGERNDAVVASINHKMGYRGAVNCAFNFGEGAYRPGGTSGAIGYLVGEPNRGLSYMFHMMNEARIIVGLGATTLGYTGYLHSLDYARNRPQGRPAGVRDVSAAQVPIIEHPDVRRMLLAQKSYVEAALALNLYCARLVDETASADTAEAREQAGLLLEILTPIAKSWPSQWCLEANNLAIQIHGGYGYTRDYNVEQFYRDNRLNPIHEGTHGIQAIDLLGRKVVMQDGIAFALLQERWAETARSIRELNQPSLASCAEVFEEAVAGLRDVTQKLHAADNLEATIAHASVYLEAFGHIVIAWIWLEQVLAAVGRDDEFARGKRQAMQFFFRWELPKARSQIAILDTLDDTVLEMRPAWF